LGVGASDSEFLAKLGQRVRAAREQLGMARKALSASADVSERYLAQLEAGEGNASVVLLRRVATALGVRLTDLLTGDEHTTEHRLITRFLDSLPAERLEEVLHRLVQEFGHDDAMRRKRIALIGLRGAGKSTLGRELAKELRRPFVELDREIETEAGMELSEIFLLYGQAGYRRIERRCLERIINGQGDLVISVGGGIVSESETYQLLLLNCFTVWIRASPEEHMARVVAQGDLRPIAGRTQAMADLREILAVREPLYGKADALVDTSGKSVKESAALLGRIVAATTAG
jgi:XRE family aerobic/anaerobic benzoate catabolism transcriptional regulator